MTTLSFTDLFVVDGPDKGMRYTLSTGQYRVVCCQIGKATLLQELNPDQAERLLFFTHTLPPALAPLTTRGPDISLSDPSIAPVQALFYATDKGVEYLDFTTSNPPISIRYLQIFQIGKTLFMPKIG